MTATTVPPLPERYVVTSRIGIGGTATVYRALDTHLDRAVAVKVIHPHVAADPLLRSRLETEIQLNRTLSHPGVIRVFDLIHTDQIMALIMEWAGGGDLHRAVLLRDHLSTREVRRLAIELLETLAAAHEAGIIHRDIKPRNVLFSEAGKAKLADFGLAIGATTAGISQSEMIVGTAEYTAPETITAGLWDARSDLYALGCTLYEALTGRPPFVANEPKAVLRMHLHSPRPDPACDDERLNRLLGHLLARDANDRFQSATEALHFLTASGAVHEPTATRGATCPWCGAPMSDSYRWCFSCARPAVPAVRKRRGGYTVMVSGPGSAGDQLSPELRDRAAEVADAVGLDAAPLRKRLPRLPFIVGRQLDRGSAARVTAELQAAGMEAGVYGPGALPMMRVRRSVVRKAGALTPRVYLIMAGMSGGYVSVINNSPGWWSIGVLGALLAAVPVVTTLVSRRASARWPEREARGAGSETALTEVLTTVRDPRLHARMQSLCTTAALVRQAVADREGLSDADRCELVEAVDATVERSARLTLALTAAQAGRASASHVAAARGTEQLSGAVSLMRDLDTLTNQILDQIGRSAQKLRGLALEIAAGDAIASGSAVARARDAVLRVSDEHEARSALERFLEEDR